MFIVIVCIFLLFGLKTKKSRNCSRNGVQLLRPKVADIAELSAAGVLGSHF